MKVIKKTIAFVSAAAMVTQLGFIMPVSAEEGDKVYYSQDYENVGAVSEVWTSQNAQANLTLETDKTKYVKYTNDMSSAGGQRVNTRTSYSKIDVDIENAQSYVVEFDLALTPGGQDASQFAIATGDVAASANTAYTGNYILSMSAPGNSNVWTINGVTTSTVTLTSEKWYHYTYYVDHSQGLATITIEDEDGNKAADKMLVPVSGEPANITGLFYLAGRYYSLMSFDNFVVRSVNADDQFGEKEDEIMSSIDIVSAPTLINQPAEGESVDEPITIRVNGSYGGDITDQSEITWTWKGNDKDDGYITFTPEGATCNVNVRNGVSDYYIVVEAKVVFGGETRTVSVPFAIIGSTSISSNQIIPDKGYPVNMDSYPDSLIGYTGTSNAINSKDVILDNWSIYGSNPVRSMQLVDFEGKRAIMFADNAGGGSTVATYQWPTQTNQYIIDFTTYVVDGVVFGAYSNTPNNSNAIAEWSFSCSSGTLTAGTETIQGINSNAWYRFVVSADPSVGTYTVTAYNDDGELIGKTADVSIPENTSGKSIAYMCISGKFPAYINSLYAYNPITAKVDIVSSADVVKVPESGEEASTLDLTANCETSDGLKVTGDVNWSLGEEYAGVSISQTGPQTAKLVVEDGASGEISVVAIKDGISDEKRIQLTTSSDVVSFTKSTSSITIPFEGEENVVAEYSAVTLDKDGMQVEGKEITYDLLASDGVNPASLKGVTFENGVLTVEPGANPGIVYVRAKNNDGLVNRVRVNIHGLSFKFGSAEPEEGYTQVVDTLYTEKQGYGFVSTNGLAVNEDNIAGSEEYRFKANVPNGNYVIDVSTTAANMTSEVIETVPVSTGVNKTGSNFQVAVCDGVLDLTFPAGSSITSLNISQAAAKTPLEKPKLYAIGDSTTDNKGPVVDDVYGREYCSWARSVSNGSVDLPDCLSGFSNNGMAGRNSASYYREGRLEAVLLSVNPGDYVTINMGINSETNEGESYYTIMKDYYVQGVIQRGAIPIILTATPDGPGYNNSVGTYDKETGHFSVACPDRARNPVLRQIASELNLDLIDVGQWGEDYYNSLTMDDVTAYNEEYGTSFATVYDMVHYWQPDHNHYIEPLSSKIAEFILGEVAKICEEDNQPLTVDMTKSDDGQSVVINASEAVSSVKLLKAAYNADGSLSSVTVAAESLSKGDNTIAIGEAAPEGGKIKYILLESDTTMVPLCNALEI